MNHAAEVLERLVRDLKIVSKNLSLTPTDNLHSILGDAADQKSEPDSLSEVAYFAELIAERRAALGAREPRRYLAGLRLPAGVVPKNRVEIVGRGQGDVLEDDLDIPCKPLQNLCHMDHLACSPQPLGSAGRPAASRSLTVSRWV